MLEKTEELSKHRMRVADMMLSSISEEMRQQKRVKEQVFKKVGIGGRRGEGGGDRGRERGKGREPRGRGDSQTLCFKARTVISPTHIQPVQEGHVLVTYEVDKQRPFNNVCFACRYTRMQPFTTH